MLNSALIGAAAAVLYLISSIVLGVRLARGGAEIPRDKTTPLGLGLGALVLHGILLYQIVMTSAGVNLGFFNSFSLVAWLIALLLLLTALGKPVENLGILILPLAGLTVVLVLLFPSNRILSPSTPIGLETHIVTSIIAYSVLSIAAVQALLLAVQERQLRNRRPGGFIRALPPLQTMETLLFQMIWLGFVLLGIALLTGLLFIEDMFAQRLAHKTVLSIAAWGVFGILLWGRHRFGWRGRIAIRWTLGGIVALMLAYFGSKLVLELILGIPAGA